MRLYKPSDSHLFCGHWNGSPLEIGFMPMCLKKVPTSERLHFHDYHEHGVIIRERSEPDGKRVVEV